MGRSTMSRSCSRASTSSWVAPSLLQGLKVGMPLVSTVRTVWWQQSSASEKCSLLAIRRQFDLRVVAALLLHPLNLIQHRLHAIEVVHLHLHLGFLAVDHPHGLEDDLLGLYGPRLHSRPGTSTRRAVAHHLLHHHFVLVVGLRREIESASTATGLAGDRRRHRFLNHPLRRGGASPKVVMHHLMLIEPLHYAN